MQVVARGAAGVRLAERLVRRRARAAQGLSRPLGESLGNSFVSVTAPPLELASAAAAGRPAGAKTAAARGQDGARRQDGGGAAAPAQPLCARGSPDGLGPDQPPGGGHGAAVAAGHGDHLPARAAARSRAAAAARGGRRARAPPPAEPCNAGSPCYEGGWIELTGAAKCLRVRV
jgi:hypothetical protein